MMEVNFWKYAINEKCQDAFICYLLNFEETRNEFFEYCGMKGDILIKEDPKNDKCPIKLQHKKIDVLVETNNNYLIIEDKVDSSEHDNQLKKYIEALKEEYSDDKPIHVCYVKSGYLSQQEKRDITESLVKINFSTENLHFIDLSRLLEIAKLDKSDKIIKQWIDKYEKEFKKQNDIIKYIKENIASKNYEELYRKVFKKENEKDYLQPYLDILTEKIRKETSYKEANWFLAGYGTAHIELKDKEETKREYISDKCWTSYSSYVMFRKKRPQLVFKQHFFEKEREGNRIGTDKYSSIGLDKVLLTSKRNLRELPKDWKKVSEENMKDKLMLCKKLLNINDALIEVLKTEQNNINKIFKALK